MDLMCLGVISGQDRQIIVVGDLSFGASANQVLSSKPFV
jgi:hypothetical protein